MPLDPAARADARESAGLTEALCAAATRVRYEALPAGVVRAAKRLVLDALGVIGGAARAPGIAALERRLARWEAGGAATGLIGARRYSPPSAALVNGTAAHALDYDDQHDLARVHTSCVVLPALLATAEEAGPVGGREFLAAFVLGAEVHARLGLACWNSLGKGWHPTMVFGTLAASLACGRLLRLDAAGLRHALGIAYHQCSGSAQSMREGALTKRLGAGLAARAALTAAGLAAEGFTSTRATLEGEAGLFALYERGEVRPERLLAGFGADWRVLEYSFKPYPCCRCNHTLIELALEAQAQGIALEALEQAEIWLGKVNWLTVGAPYDAARGEVAHAQFNAAYSFARALADGRVDLRSYEPAALRDARVAGLAARVRVRVDPAIEPTAIEPARVTLRLRDGSVRELAAATMKGSPARPMSDEELFAKLRDCLGYGLGATSAEAERLAAAVAELERAPDAARALVAAFPRLRDPGAASR